MGNAPFSSRRYVGVQQYCCHQYSASLASSLAAQVALIGAGPSTTSSSSTLKRSARASFEHAALKLHKLVQTTIIGAP
eukprot:1709912-Amphidinium_carterae.1